MTNSSKILHFTNGWKTNYSPKKLQKEPIVKLAIKGTQQHLTSIYINNLMVLG
jgi:hypothetical protein